VKLFCRWPSYAGAAVLLIFCGCRSYRYTGRIVGKTDYTPNPSSVVEERYHIGAIDVHTDDSEVLKAFSRVDDSALKRELARRNRFLRGDVNRHEHILVEIKHLNDVKSDVAKTFLNSVTMGLLPFSKELTSKFTIEIYPLPKRGVEPISIDVAMTQEKRFTPFVLWPFLGEGDGCVSYSYFGLGGQGHRRALQNCYVDLIDAGLKVVMPKCDKISMKRNSVESGISQKRGIAPAMQDRMNAADQKSEKKLSEPKVSKQESIKHSKEEEKISLESMLKEGLITTEEYERMKK
jgi:hypothetical protein